MRPALRDIMREFQAMPARAATGEEGGTTLHLARIQRQVADVDVARHRRDAGQQLRQRHDAGGRRHRATIVATPVSGSADSSRRASGATPISRSAPPTTAENTGAAISPP